MNKAVEQILKTYKLSITQSRAAILNIFQDSPAAISHAFVENKLKDSIDRVTVYRTLQTFLSKGIIHPVPTKDHTALYALCSEACSNGHHHDNHIHFECTSCGNTTCLDDVLIPAVKLPRGFSPARSSMVVEGVCKQCK